MTLSMGTMIINQQVYVHTYIYVYDRARMCLCQLASIRIVRCLSIKLLSDFGQSDILYVSTAKMEYPMANENFHTFMRRLPNSKKHYTLTFLFLR